MGNNVSDKLPNSIDNRLQDIAQMYGEITYSDIIKFGKVAEKNDLKKLKKLFESYEYEDEQEESTLISNFVKSVIKK